MMMLSKLKKIFSGIWPGKYARLDEADIDKAIDMVVDETDARLRLISGYRRKLRKPVIRSLVYVNYLVARIPAPIEISRKAYGIDPRVNALFASVNEMQDLFRRSKQLKGLFEDAPDNDRVYTTLGMIKTEKNILGMELKGEMVRREVAQVAVNFSDHWLGVCGLSEDEVRKQMKWRGIHSLAASALENITRLKGKTGELEKQRALLKVKLRVIGTRHRGLEALAGDAPEEGQDRHATLLRLEEVEQGLRESHASLGTLDDYLDQVRKVLSHPSRYLGVRMHSVRVDRLGIKVTGGDEHQGAEVETAEITIGGKAPVEVLLVTFPRTEMQG